MLDFQLKSVILIGWNMSTGSACKVCKKSKVVAGVKSSMLGGCNIVIILVSIFFFREYSRSEMSGVHPPLCTAHGKKARVDYLQVA